MVNTFNDILYKFSNKQTLQDFEIEYLNQLLIKYPYFKLCKKLISANNNNFLKEETVSSFISENIDNKDHISLIHSNPEQFKQMEIVQKYLNNPFNFYDLLK